MATRMQERRDTAANWTANNPTLAAGELGIETDTGKFKIGDGATAWATLKYAAVLASTLTTKGDIFVATGAGVVVRLPVGVDGQPIVADSSQASGLGYGAIGVINNQTGTAYTPTLADANGLITMDNAAANAFTIPTNASVPYRTLTQLTVMWLTGAGQPTISAVTPATTTILSEGAATMASPKIAVVNAMVVATKIATDTWVVTGHIA